MKSIGIKLADGSFYPVLEEGSAEKKKLELTTVQDNQTTVQIDLYRSESGSIDDAEYVDTLEIRNMRPHPNGEPNLQLDISLDENNQLKAEILDPETGKVSETQVRLVSRTLAERNEPVNFNIDDVTNVSDAAPESYTEDTDVFANTIANDLPPVEATEGNDMNNASPNDEGFSFEGLDSDLDSILNSDDSGNQTPGEIEEDITEEPATTDDGFDFGDVAVGTGAGLAAGAIAGAAAGYALASDDSDSNENNIESIIEDPDSNDLSPSDSLSDFNLDDYAPTEASDDAGNISEIEENLGLSDNSEDAAEFSENDVIDVPTGEDSISDSEIETDLELPGVPEDDILSTESVLSSLDNDGSILDEETANQIEEDAVFQSLGEDSGSDSILDGLDDIEGLNVPAEESVSDDAESADLPDLGNFIEESEDESGSSDSDLSSILNDSAASEDNLDLPDFGDVSDESGILSESDSDSVSEEQSDDLGIPDFNEGSSDEMGIETEVVSEEASENSELPDFGESAEESPMPDFSFDSEDNGETSVIDESAGFAETSEESAADDFQLPDFGDESPSDTVDPSETAGSEVDFAASVPDDSGSADFELPDFESNAEEPVASDTPVETNASDFDLPDFGSVDLSNAETSTDEYITKDKTFVPENSMFNDLYDEETKEGITAETKIGEEKIRSKTKVHVIICLICTIICIAAALLVLFVIPSRVNISQLINKNKPATEEVAKAPESKKEESKKEESKKEDKSSTSIVITKDSLPDPIPDPEPAAPDTSAKEDQIVVASVPEVVVPETPSAPAEKPKDVHYKIVWGDTLWDIADSYYKNPWRYKRIAKYNGIKNPNRIISGTWIWIPAE